MSLNPLSISPVHPLKPADNETVAKLTMREKKKDEEPASPAKIAVESKAKQEEALTKLLQMYKSRIEHGQNASSLKSLAREIAAAATALGKSVVLPTADAALSSAQRHPATDRKPAAASHIDLAV